MKKFLAVILVVLLVVFLFAGCTTRRDILLYEEYKIKSGDTLWNIAEKTNGYNHYKSSDIVADIEAASGCSALIYPGDTILIPVYDI